MVLFEISTGACGESFVRSYVWAENEAVARALFHAAFPKERIEDVNYVLDSRDRSFVTGLSDTGFAKRIE